MAIHTAPTKLHWNFFSAIEDDVQRLARFIEFDANNFQCYSLEVARILLAASSEVDIVCEQLCLQFDPASSANNINHYRDELVAAIPALPDFQVVIRRHSLTLMPWDEWHDSAHGVPLWWRAHNKVKHERHSHYYDANLKNALNSVAALFVILLYLYKEDAEKGRLVSSEFALAGQHASGSAVLVRAKYKL
jgi:hypothetical protein